MANFPSIMAPNYPLQETHKDHSRKGEVSNTTIITSPRFTKAPLSFRLTWNSLPAADYDLLRNFYDNVVCCGALDFNWTHPDDGGNYANKVFRVRFDGDLEFRLIAVGRYEGSVKLAEV
ncbi:MAG: hypothetical protein IJ694_04830 [Acidaminococcaceae bacterium]|nr:hypothetical protein [Acidaminococcaceae bacterium]MBR1661580.1 hypothetical protein [Acidaminococcaceae bacterium]